MQQYREAVASRRVASRHRDLIMPACTAEQTTRRTDAFSLQTGNIFLINRGIAASIWLDRCPLPPADGLPSLRFMSWPGFRHGGRFSVNSKGTAEKRMQSTRRRRTGGALIRRWCPCAVHAWSLLPCWLSPDSVLTVGRNGPASGRRLTMRLPVKLSPNSIRGRPASDRRRVRQPTAVLWRFRLFLSTVQFFFKLHWRWWLALCTENATASSPVCYFTVSRRLSPSEIIDEVFLSVSMCSCSRRHSRSLLLLKVGHSPARTSAPLDIGSRTSAPCASPPSPRKTNKATICRCWSLTII